MIWTRAQRKAFNGLTARMREDVETTAGPHGSIVVRAVSQRDDTDGRRWFITPAGSTHRMDAA